MKKVVVASIRLLRFYLEVGRAHQAEQLFPRLRERIGALPDSRAAPLEAVIGELESELMFMKGDFDDAERIARAALAFCGTGPRGAAESARSISWT